DHCLDDQDEPTSKRQAAPNDLPVSQQPDYDGDEWYTPGHYIALVKKVMGGIDLDPASCQAANQVVGATLFYDKEANGLVEPWSGRVWLNPPYSHPDPFVQRAIVEFERGEIAQAMILLNNATETTWFQSLIAHYPACFPSQRIQFWHPGRKSESPRQGQAIFYLGERVAEFIRYFKARGVIVAPLEDQK
ncbi:MAG: hypothetical protein JXA89_07470, partial [Anaerolineae bacterium]|nr:hypothetical protein [Anaerolineae bacterium]